MDKIKFVRKYKAYSHFWWEVVYKSGRIVTYTSYDGIPKTVRKFLEHCTVREYYDSLYKRNELIYEI